MQEDIAKELIRTKDKRIQSLRRSGLSRQDAEDSVGEAWLKLDGHTVREGGSASGLVSRTIQNVGKDIHKKNKKSYGVIEIDAPDAIEPVDPKNSSTPKFSYSKAHFSVIRDTLTSLGIKNPIDQKIFFLDLIDFSNREGAIHLNLTPPQYKSRLVRARSQIWKYHSQEAVIDFFQTHVTFHALNSEEETKTKLIFAKIFSSYSNKDLSSKQTRKRYTSTQLPSDIIEKRKQFAFDFYRISHETNAPTLAEATRFIASHLDTTFSSARDVMYGFKSLSPSRLEILYKKKSFQAFGQQLEVFLNPNPSDKLHSDPKRYALSCQRKKVCTLLRSSVNDFSSLDDAEIIKCLFGFKSTKHAQSILQAQDHVSVQGQLQSTQFILLKLGYVSKDIADALLCFLPPESEAHANVEHGRRLSTLTMMSAVEHRDDTYSAKQYAQILFSVSSTAADQIVNRGEGDLGVVHSRTLIEKYEQLKENSDILERIDPSCFFAQAKWYRRLADGGETTLSAYRRLLVVALGISMQNGIADSLTTPRKHDKLFEILMYDMFSESDNLHGPILGNTHLNLFEISQLKSILMQSDFDPAAAFMFLPHGQAWCTIDMVSQFRTILSQKLVDKNQSLSKDQRYRLQKGYPTNKESIDYLQGQIEKQPVWMRSLLDPMSLEIVYTLPGKAYLAD